MEGMSGYNSILTKYTPFYLRSYPRSRTHFTHGYYYYYYYSFVFNYVFYAETPPPHTASLKNITYEEIGLLSVLLSSNIRAEEEKPF